jgi:hypothetical protein
VFAIGQEVHVKAPEVEFAPHPNRLARPLFADDVIDAHLSALAAKQQPAGGWPLTWEPPSAAAVCEWRGYVTLKWLEVLDNYQHLDC